MYVAAHITLEVSLPKHFLKKTKLFLL